MIALLIAIVAVSSDPCLGSSAWRPGPCHYVVAFGRIEYGYDYDSVAFVRAYYGDEQSFLICASDVIRHRDDPAVRLGYLDTANRWVRACDVHWFRGIEVISGMPPRDFALAVAAAEIQESPSGRPMALADSLVWRGLGANRSATRQAAQDCLVRMGERAIGACVVGLRAQDAEVRWRCRLILDEIRNGVSSR